MATPDSNADPFDALMQQRMSNQPNADQEAAPDPFDQAMAARFNKQAASPAQTDPYEAKIQANMPVAEQQAKDLGYTGAIATGAGEMLGVGPALREAGTDIAAAAGYGQGDTFGQRREDLKAQYEALRRASGEQYPKTQLAADIGSQFLIPFAGEIAGPAAGAAEALGAAPTVARIAGMGVEAGALGAGSAAEEKLIGSKPESEQADIGTSGALGAGLGLGLGAVGEGIAKGASAIAPDWMKALTAPGDAALTNLSNSLLLDEANGTSKMPIADLIQAAKDGQPIKGADIGGPKFQQTLTDIAKKNPDAVSDLMDQLRERLADGGQRFDEFATEMNKGIELNAAKLQADAAQEFQNRNEAAWAPIKNPELGKGTWLPQWDNLLDKPVFQDAVKNAEVNLTREMGPAFKSPFMNTGDTPISNLDFPPDIVSTFNDYGIKTYDDLTKIKPISLKSMFAVDPADNTAAAKLRAKAQTNDLVDQLKSTIESLPPPQMVLADPNNINMKYIDQVRRELSAMQDAAFTSPAGTEGGVGKTIKNVAGTLMDPLRDPKNANYSPELDYAIKNSADIFGEKDAFTGGLRLLDKDRNTLAQTNAYNSTINMTPQEKTLARQGVLASLLTKTRNSDGSLNTKMLQRYFDPNNYTAKAIRNIFENNGYEKLERFVKTEALFRNTLANFAKGAGRSDPNLYGSLQKLNLVPTWLYSKPAAMAQYVYSIADHFMGQRYAKRLADKLASTDIEQFRDAQKMLQSNPRLLSAMAKNMIRVSAAAPTVGQNFVPSRAAGGRVGYEEGGQVDYKNELPVDVYHGTQQPISRLEDRGDDYSLSRGLGIHVAKDPAVASNEYFTARGADPYAGGRVMPLKMASEDKFHQIHQPYIPDMGVLYHDDWAIRNEIMSHAYTHHPNLFVKDLMEQWHVPEEEARKAHHQLTSGEMYRDSSGIGANNMWGFVKNFGLQPYNPDDRKFAVQSYRNHLRNQGYVGVKYQNTGSSETKGAKDKTAFIVFPEDMPKGQTFPLRGRFANFDPSRKHESDLEANKGGFITRPKRATGGRIPEVDKLFKAAKRTLDDGTKPMLNMHDDDIVKALRIMQGRV